ncbi:hypothetical protein CDAR_61591 [Caerostris darwini]|uniref:Maturase K n=1 Tax=Caerostris darwini TaxID=1538125 RepID=A0AAV4R4X6_9ARAC|nr:hypothetical protein CDAR_61591 [Caerostris darwini]
MYACMLLFPKRLEKRKGWGGGFSSCSRDPSESAPIIAYYRCCFPIGLGEVLKYFECYLEEITSIHKIGSHSMEEVICVCQLPSSRPRKPDSSPFSEIF